MKQKHKWGLKFLKKTGLKIGEKFYSVMKAIPTTKVREISMV